MHGKQIIKKPSEIRYTITLEIHSINRIIVNKFSMLKLLLIFYMFFLSTKIAREREREK